MRRSPRVSPRSAPPALYGILGFPLGHTLSPVMQQAAFDALGLRARYAAFEVPPAHLSRGVQLLRRLNVAGFNVTVPHKQTILRHLDRVDRIARRLGAVNTVVRRGSRLIGYNTDASGLLAAWRAAPRLRVRGTTVLLLGAGGAARAVVWAAHQAGAKQLFITNRTRSHAEHLARWAHRAVPRLRVMAILWAQRHLMIRCEQPQLLINATSLGLHASDCLPVNLAALSRRAVIYDLTYRHPTTTWVARARRRGMLAYDGRDMLLYQGAQAFTQWMGRAAPLRVMRRALECGSCG